jgi:parallel beta-helix repeat protein
VFTSNLAAPAGYAGDGIIIAANALNDTVEIDLNGFALVGVTGSGDGIGGGGGAGGLVGIAARISIRNGTVRRWGGSGLTVQGIRLAEVENVLVLDNGGSGVFCVGECIVRNSTANFNGDEGVYVGENSIVSGCLATNNTLDGIRTGDSTVVADCSSRFNSGNGIFVERTNGPLPTGGVIRNCQVSQNALDGILVQNEVLVVGNNCVANGFNAGSGAGVHATGSRNRIEANTVVSNDRGIDVDIADNVIIRNSASGNTTEYDIAAGNTAGPIVTTATIAGSSNPHANYDY